MKNITVILEENFTSLQFHNNILIYFTLN